MPLSRPFNPEKGVVGLGVQPLTLELISYWVLSSAGVNPMLEPFLYFYFALHVCVEGGGANSQPSQQICYYDVRLRPNTTSATLLCLLACQTPTTETHALYWLPSPSLLSPHPSNSNPALHASHLLIKYANVLQMKYLFPPSLQA